LAAGAPAFLAAVLVRGLVDSWQATAVVGITVVVAVYGGSVFLLGLTDDDRLVLGVLSGGTRGRHQLAAD
jgi:hypothetical protein